MIAPSYLPRSIPKPGGGGRRLLWEPSAALKVAQRQILRRVLSGLTAHVASHGNVRGRCPFTHASVHVGAALVVTLDLRAFFPSITTPRVAGVFRGLGLGDGPAQRLALLCTREGTLPQGAPTSPAVANACASRLDRRLVGLARRLGWRFSRYVDDLAFSRPSKPTRAEVAELLVQVAEIIEDEGFQVNRQKTLIMPAGGPQLVTGLVVNGPGAPRVPRKRRRQIRGGIHNAEWGYPEEPEHWLAGRVGHLRGIEKMSRAAPK